MFWRQLSIKAAAALPTGMTHHLCIQRLDLDSKTFRLRDVSWKTPATYLLMRDTLVSIQAMKSPGSEVKKYDRHIERVPCRRQRCSWHGEYWEHWY